MKHDFLKRNRYYIIISGIAILHFIFILCFSNIKSLWYDDIYQIYFSWDRTFADSMNIVSKVDLNPPLWAVLSFLWLKIAPFGTAWVKLPSMLLVSMSTVIVGAIGKDLYGKRVGVIASVLFSLSSLVTLECAYSFRPYGLYLFASVFIIWAYIKKIKEQTRRSRIIFGLAVFILAFTHYFGALLCVFLAISDVVLWLNKKQKISFIIEYAIVASLEIFWLIPQLTTIGSALSAFWPSRPTILSYFKAFKYLLFDSILLTLIFFALAVFFIITVFKKIKGRSTKELLRIDDYSRIIFLLIPVFFILLIFIYSNIKPESSVWVDRYFFSLYPMLILFISSVSVEAYDKIKMRRLKIISCITALSISLLVFVPMYAGNVIRSVYTEYEPFEQVAEMIMEQPEIKDGQDVLVINTTNCGRGWNYYLSKNNTRNMSNVDTMDLVSFSSNTIIKFDVVYLYAVHFDGSFSLDKIREEISQTHAETIIDAKYNIYKYVRIK